MGRAEAVSPQIVPVILSGGSGTRLWPLSRSLYPKQFLPLASERTLLQETLLRVAGGGGFAAPIVVCNEEHRFIVAEQARLVGIEPQAIVLEPMGRNTAAAVAVAALMVAGRDPHAHLLVMPSDHVIGLPEAFQAAIAAGSRTEDRLVTFGVKPTRPETGFGYIEAGDAVDGDETVRTIRRFVEKPDAATAAEYVAAGSFLWNSGIFLLPAGTFLAELERLAPDVLKACKAAVAGEQRDLGFQRLDRQAFAACPSVSIDVAVMERTDRGAVVPVDMAWSDVGSWSALWEIAQRDADGNASSGPVFAVDTRDSYLRSAGPVLATVGLDNVVVVATKDAVLVTSRDRAQDVRQAVDRLAAAGRHEHLTPPETFRPWGSFQTVDLGDRFQVKRIVVQPGQRLSLQMHHHRAEHWIVVRGTAKVTCNDRAFLLHENESTYIPLGSTHRLENPGRVPLHLIEVQSGSYLGEDDIVRFEDTYGRS